MATKATVHVNNIDGSTTDSEVRDFFSFCGKIADFQVSTSGNTKTADVTFEKDTAMKTALLLNNTKLGPNEISVTSASAVSDEDSPIESKTERDSDEITQEEKPRARILAEYLAHGYVVGDAAIHRAIDLDQKHGVSSRFVTTLQNLDKKYHATDRAKATDQNYGITQRANSFLTGISTYFEKATNTPTGKKLVNFYTNSSRQVQEIHAEAQRLAELKKEHGGSAYKASGLERVFGKEKDKSGSSTSPTTAQPGSATAATDAGAGIKAADEKTG